MSHDVSALQLRLRRWTLILGVAQITMGCLVGFIPPTAVEWFRGIVMGHIEYTANGVLIITFGLILHELRLQATGLKVWFTTLQIGTWTNGTAGLLAGLIGYSSVLMPTINEKFPAPHGSDHVGVTALLQLCGVTMIIALFLTLYGLVRSDVPRSEKPH
ncbi:MAG TPA: hypothetical protein VJL88_14805 [Nitrospira sp.]|nr:hypothetical protein [Nitrospira sp.]